MKKALLIMILPLMISIKADAKEVLTVNEEYVPMIEEICEEYNICPELVETIIWHESRFIPTVVGSGKYIGMMQIHPGSHKDRMKRLGVTDLKDARQNITVGVDYLAELFEEYEDPGVVLDYYSGQPHEITWYEAGNMTKYSRLILEESAGLEREHEK